MDEDAFDDYERGLELALFKEYRDVASQFKYVVETERRFYLANEVHLVRRDSANDFYFELTMSDVWVWDVYRSDRFVKQVLAGAASATGSMAGRTADTPAVIVDRDEVTHLLPPGEGG